MGMALRYVFRLWFLWAHFRKLSKIVILYNFCKLNFRIWWHLYCNCVTFGYKISNISLLSNKNIHFKVFHILQNYNNLYNAWSFWSSNNLLLSCCNTRIHINVNTSSGLGLPKPENPTSTLGLFLKKPLHNNSKISMSKAEEFWTRSSTIKYIFIV